MLYSLHKPCLKRIRNIRKRKVKEAYNPLSKIRSPCRRGRNSLYCRTYLVTLIWKMQYCYITLGSGLTKLCRNVLLNTYSQYVKMDVIWNGKYNTDTYSTHISVLRFYFQFLINIHKALPTAVFVQIHWKLKVRAVSELLCMTWEL